MQRELIHTVQIDARTLYRVVKDVLQSKVDNITLFVEESDLCFRICEDCSQPKIDIWVVGQYNGEKFALSLVDGGLWMSEDGTFAVNSDQITEALWNHILAQERWIPKGKAMPPLEVLPEAIKYLNKELPDMPIPVLYYCLGAVTEPYLVSVVCLPHSPSGKATEEHFLLPTCDLALRHAIDIIESRCGYKSKYESDLDAKRHRDMMTHELTTKGFFNVTPHPAYFYGVSRVYQTVSVSLRKVDCL